MEKINREEIKELFSKTLWNTTEGVNTGYSVMKIVAILLNKIDELCDEVDKLNKELNKKGRKKR